MNIVLNVGKIYFVNFEISLTEILFSKVLQIKRKSETEPVLIICSANIEQKKPKFSAASFSAACDPVKRNSPSSSLL